jgi:hypothetical protein
MRICTNFCPVAQNLYVSSYLKPTQAVKTNSSSKKNFDKVLVQGLLYTVSDYRNFDLENMPRPGRTETVKAG